MVLRPEANPLKKPKPPRRPARQRIVVRHPFLGGPNFFAAWKELGERFNQVIVERDPFGGRSATREVEVIPSNLPLELAKWVIKAMTKSLDDQSLEAKVVQFFRDPRVTISAGDVREPIQHGCIEFHLPPPVSSGRGRKRKPETFQRDLEILRLREQGRDKRGGKLSFGKIGLRLRIGPRGNVTEAAYRRMKIYRAKLRKAYKLLKKHFFLVEFSEMPRGPKVSLIST
jgi:hypothetical protein